MSLSSPLTLSIVKNELGITATTWDTEITERIPFAEAKFRQVAGYQFNYIALVWYTSGKADIRVYIEPNGELDFFNYGDIVLSADFADGTHVLQNYKIPSTSDAGFYDIKLSSNATDDSDANGSEMVVSYNISNYSVLSQIVWYMIDQQSTDEVLKKSVQSKRMGPVSITYGPGDINQKFGLPNKIVQQIPMYESIY
jgi:hypothetical protein